MVRRMSRKGEICALDKFFEYSLALLRRDNQQPLPAENCSLVEDIRLFL